LGYEQEGVLFLYYERAYSPIQTARTVTVLTPEAQSGIYKWVDTAGQTQMRNVITLAAAKGGPTMIDPIARSILDINNQVPYSRQRFPITILIATPIPGELKITTTPTSQLPDSIISLHLNKQFIWTWNYRHNWQAGERRLPYRI